MQRSRPWGAPGLRNQDERWPLAAPGRAEAPVAPLTPATCPGLYVQHALNHHSRTRRRPLRGTTAPPGRRPDLSTKFSFVKPTDFNLDSECRARPTPSAHNHAHRASLPHAVSCSVTVAVGRGPEWSGARTGKSGCTHRTADSFPGPGSSQRALSHPSLTTQSLVTKPSGGQNDFKSHASIRNAVASKPSLLDLELAAQEQVPARRPYWEEGAFRTLAQCLSPGQEETQPASSEQRHLSKGAETAPFEGLRGVKARSRHNRWEGQRGNEVWGRTRAGPS